MKIWNRIENHYFCLNAKSKFRYIVRKIGHPPLSLCIICIYFIHFYIYILCVWFKLVSILWCGFQIPIHPIEFLNFVCDLRVRTPVLQHEEKTYFVNVCRQSSEQVCSAERPLSSGIEST